MTFSLLPYLQPPRWTEILAVDQLIHIQQITRFSTHPMSFSDTTIKVGNNTAPEVLLL